MTTARGLRTWWGAVVFALACQLAGVIGAATTTTGSSPWYQALEKPSFQPPGWVFGPVWTLLYAMMGVAAWRVWRRGGDTPGVRLALVLFGVQLLLNTIWSPVFFGAQAIIVALFILATLWLAVLATIVAFRRVDRIAGWLLVPYLAWVSFATVLNFAIVQLNAWS